MTALRFTMASGPGIAADERPAQVDAVIGKAHGQAVAQQGRIRKVAQIHLPTAGLADHAAVIRLDLIGPRCLPGGSELFQRDSRRIVGSTAFPCRTAGAVCRRGSRISLHGQRSQDIGRCARRRALLDSLALLFAIFQNGRDGQRQQQDRCNDPRQPQAGACLAAPSPAMGGMIFV